jgi:hypothetical protein
MDRKHSHVKSILPKRVEPLAEIVGWGVRTSNPRPLCLTQFFFFWSNALPNYSSLYLLLFSYLSLFIINYEEFRKGKLGLWIISRCIITNGNLSFNRIGIIIIKHETSYNNDVRIRDNDSLIIGSYHDSTSCTWNSIYLSIIA